MKYVPKKTLIIIVIFIVLISGSLIIFATLRGTNPFSPHADNSGNQNITEDLPQPETENAAPITPQPIDSSQGQNTVGISAESAAYGVGQEFDVTVIAAANTEVNTTQLYLEYDPTLLELKDISYDSSDFGIAAEEVRSNGRISIARATINPVSGDITIASLRFRALKASDATVSIAEGSALLSGSTSTNVLTDREAFSVTIN